MNVEVLGSLTLVAGLWYWFSAKTLQELAFHAVTQRCEQLQLQMLDQYVALQNIRFGRDALGHRQIIRTYGFEFSSTGNERYHGQIILAGQQVKTIQFEAYRVLDVDG